MEPTNMPAKHPDTDAVMPSGVHGQHHSVNDEHMPRSLWFAGVVRRLADYIRQLRKVIDESNQCAFARQSAESNHVCTRNPHRTCNCDAWVCADDSATYRYARGQFRAANFNCPISGQLCSSTVCREWCKGSSAGATTDVNRGDASTTINR
jgi:hypothetical protein